MPLSNVNVTVKGETKATNLLGIATFELTYGRYAVKATLGEKTKTIHVLMNSDKTVGITFGKRKKVSAAFSIDCAHYFVRD